MFAWVTTLLFICAAFVRAQTVTSEVRVASAGLAVAGQSQHTPQESHTISLAGLAASPGGAAAPNGITYTCDPSITAVAGVCNTLNSTAAGLYAGIFSNLSASIYVKFANIGGDAGQSNFLLNDVSYTTFRNALQSHITSANDATAFSNSVPPANPISAGDNVFL